MIFLRSLVTVKFTADRFFLIAAYNLKLYVLDGRKAKASINCLSADNHRVQKSLIYKCELPVLKKGLKKVFSHIVG